MPVAPNDSVNSAVQGQSANSFEPEKTAGKAGSRKVDTVDTVEPSLPISEGKQATTSELTENVQPAEAKSVLGRKDSDSAVKIPEEQLNAILSDAELARCYKSQAKDAYFNASEYALTELQSFMGNVDLDRNPKKMAKEFNRALKSVRSALKGYERDVSDLKVTVTTRSSGPVQLIPFQLTEIDPEQLKELLNIALELTKDAKTQMSSDSKSVAKETYERKILSSESQISPLLEQVDSKAKETFASRFKLLKFPKIELHFDASDSRPVEKTTVKSSSPDSMKQNKLDIANTGEFYEEQVDDTGAEVHPQISDPEELLLQKNTENAKQKQKEYLKSKAYIGDAEDAVTLQGRVTQAVDKALKGRPYANWGNSEDTQDTSGIKEDPQSQGAQARRDSPQPPSAPSQEAFDQWIDARKKKQDKEPPQFPEDSPQRTETSVNTDLILFDEVPLAQPIEEYPENSRSGSEPVLIGDKPQVPLTGTNLLEMSNKQQHYFRKNKLCQYMEPNQVVELYRVRRGLVTKTDVKNYASEILADADKKDIPLPTLEALLEAEKKQVKLRKVARVGYPKNSKLDSKPVPVGDNPQVPPSGTNLLEMTVDQKRFFKEQKLWRYMTPGQVAKMFAEPELLIATDAYKAVKDKAGVKAVDALKQDITLPIFEELLEAKQKDDPPEGLVDRQIEDDGDALFRALFAFSTRDHKWISKNIAPKSEVCEMIRSEKIALNITCAIESAVKDYLDLGSETDVQKKVAEKLRVQDGPGDIVSRIFNSAIANGEFSNRSFDGLAEALDIKGVMTGNDDDPYAAELRNLAQFIFDALLDELEVPTYDSNGAGLRWNKGSFSLVVEPTYLGTDL